MFIASRFVYVCCFALALWTVHARAESIQVDNAAGLEQLFITNTLELVDFTVADNRNRMLVVTIGGEASGLNVTNVAYGSQNFTLAVKDRETLTSQQLVEIWWLANPTAGTGTVTVYSSSKVNSWCAAALSLYNVNPIGPVSTNSFASGSATTAQILLDVSGEHPMSVEVFSNNSNQGAPTRNSGQVLYYSLNPSTVGSGFRSFSATCDGFTVSPTNQTWTNPSAGRLALCGAVFVYEPPPPSGVMIKIW